MTATTTTAPAGLDELSAAELLACVSDVETAERRAGLGKLELALRWCVLHPAVAETGVAVWGDAGLPGVSECEESLGGDGTPLVAAYAPEPFAAALGVSTWSGMQLLADALDLAHRLPLTWRRVRALEVPAWKARRLAQATHHLTRDAAAHVDARVAERLHSCGGVLIDRYVAQAAALFAPEDQAAAEETAQASWDVTLTHRADGGFAGTSRLEATGDTLDLTHLYDLVCDHAAHLGRLGDTDDLGARKAKALGVIADAQTHLDLYATSPPDQPPLRRGSLAKTRVYLHLSLADLVDGHPSVERSGERVGELEQLGPVTLAKIKDWLGSTRATIVPVLHLADLPGDQELAVDEHDPPEWMRETVILRDRHCVFPWCQRNARSCDLDHIKPYVPIDEGGPPGQTAASRLAPLCRRHHNAKTSRRWHYRRDPDGTYIWHGPHGIDYVVTPLGTSQLHT
jgi:hypothetical protein